MQFDGIWPVEFPGYGYAVEVGTVEAIPPGWVLAVLKHGICVTLKVSNESLQEGDIVIVSSKTESFSDAVSHGSTILKTTFSTTLVMDTFAWASSSTRTKDIKMDGPERLCARC